MFDLSTVKRKIIFGLAAVLCMVLCIWASHLMVAKRAAIMLETTLRPVSASGKHTMLYYTIGSVGEDGLSCPLGRQCLIGCIDASSPVSSLLKFQDVSLHQDRFSYCSDRQEPAGSQSVVSWIDGANPIRVTSLSSVAPQIEEPAAVPGPAILAPLVVSDFAVGQIACLLPNISKEHHAWIDLNYVDRLKMGSTIYDCHGFPAAERLSNGWKLTLFSPVHPSVLGDSYFASQKMVMANQIVWDINKEEK